MRDEFGCLRTIHLPYALSLPFNAFLKPNTIPGSDKSYTTLLPPEEIRIVLEKSLGPSVAEKVIEGKRKITTTCGRYVLPFEGPLVRRTAAYDFQWHDGGCVVAWSEDHQ